MKRHGSLTVVVEIRPEAVEPLRELLTKIGDTVGEKGCPIDFDRLTTAHFLRWVILEASQDLRGRPLPASLVLSTDYDEPLADHLDDLVTVAGPVLDEIYAQCVGYPGHDRLVSYLLAHAEPYAARYMGTRWRGVAQIRQEEELRSAIEEFLDQQASAGPAGEDPVALRRRVQEFVFQQPKLAWAQQRPSRLAWFLWTYGNLLAVVLALAAAYVLVPWLSGIPWWVLPLATGVLLGLAAAAIGLVFFLVVRAEKRDREDPIKNPVQKVAKLVSREDQVVQNQLSHLVHVKPEWFRPVALRLVLATINFLARYVFVRGTLGGIPTIHFARWVILDGGRRLLFFSNFDGSWENYLGDFIDKAARGLTAVWSNTVGCPRAEWLVGGGARDEQRFKSWTRDHQIFTQVWYSAYKELTVDNVNNNSKVREGLHGDLGPEAAKEWLARL